jgi:hypothetical protein
MKRSWLNARDSITAQTDSAESYADANAAT